MTENARKVQERAVSIVTNILEDLHETDEALDEALEAIGSEVEFSSQDYEDIRTLDWDTGVLLPALAEYLIASGYQVTRKE